MALQPSSSMNVVLVAHGAASSSDSENMILAELAERVRAGLSRARVRVGLLVAPDVLAHVIRGMDDGPVLVLPLMFSRGYFLEQKLAPIVDAVSQERAGITLDAPLIEWGEFVMALSARLVGRDALVVAHGSSRSDRSRLAAEGLAQSIAKRTGRQASCSFLEEEPVATESVRHIGPNTHIVGLFMADGLHGGSDFAGIAAAAPFQTNEAFTVGRLSTLGDVVIARIKALETRMADKQSVQKD